MRSKLKAVFRDGLQFFVLCVFGSVESMHEFYVAWLPCMSELPDKAAVVEFLAGFFKDFGNIVLMRETRAQKYVFSLLWKMFFISDSVLEEISWKHFKIEKGKLPFYYYFFFSFVFLFIYWRTELKPFSLEVNAKYKAMR